MSKKNSQSRCKDQKGISHHPYTDDENLLPDPAVHLLDQLKDSSSLHAAITSGFLIF